MFLSFSLIFLGCSGIQIHLETEEITLKFKAKHIFHRNTTHFARFDVSEDGNRHVLDSMNHVESYLELKYSVASLSHNIVPNIFENSFETLLISKSPSDRPKEADITDKNTLINLAKIANSSYFPNPSELTFTDLLSTRASIKRNSSFGWDSDGLRGHVYSSNDDKNIIISFKGTTLGFAGIGGRTSANDKYHDNLLYAIH
jgi:putative lipase involved disintegration of autophagic bodies